MPPELDAIADQLTLPSTAAIGIPLALIAAVILAIGTQMQHGGVAKVETTRQGGKTGLSVGQLGALLARPSWVIGTVLLGLAIVLQLTSL
ncbi:MAG TPA: multidrug DMT transporter permease, partial [Rhodoglobus sp.]|nr:multidrug DMT transporter permease [Rhodoglobus sp.]